jgi:PAS domain S-box-containing protein
LLADPTILSNEARLAALIRTGLLDSEAELSYDRMTRLASKFLDAPVSQVSLVDDHRQFFKSCVGLPEPWASQRETPLSHSFCQHVVTTGQPLVIPDARLDPLVKDNLAGADLGVIAYLGIPLVIDGQVIGSFCAIDGQPRAWSDDDISILTDLAESVVTETRLRIDHGIIAQQCDAAEEDQRRLQVIVGSIGDAVLTTDAEGIITFLNPIAERLCGCTSEKAIGQELTDVFHIFDIHTKEVAENPAIPIFGQAQNAGLATVTILRSLDGSERPIESVAAPIRLSNGRIRGIVLVFRDIFERREREREIERQERLFHTLADSISQLAWTANPDGHIFWYNRRWFDYTGTTFEQMEGWGWQAVHDPAELPRVLERWQASIATGEPFDMVFPLKGKDGVFHPFLTRVMPLRDDAGNVVRWFGTNTDITEATRYENELRDARSQL